MAVVRIDASATRFYISTVPAMPEIALTAVVTGGAQYNDGRGGRLATAINLNWSQDNLRGGAERNSRSGGHAPGDPDYVANVLGQPG